jgi:hypothetical protein
VDSRDVEELSEREIAAILRAVDSVVARGGRSLAVKILKGSRDKKLLELGLDGNPSYGFYRDLTLDEITPRVDWMILNRYLAIDYAGDLPMLVFTERGWKIEREKRAQELFEGLDGRLAAGPPFEMIDLKDRNRGLILLLLEKIEGSGRRELIPLLEEWRGIEYAKVRKRIGGVISRLNE